MRRKPLMRDGYTIVETMVFLVVSLSLFSVVALISRQGQRNDFPRSIDDAQIKLQDILNDVSTGFYPTNSDFKCTSSSGGPVLADPTATEQGTNKDCIFAGKALHFAPNGQNNLFNVYTLVGNRLGTDLVNAGKEVKSLSESKPVALGIDGNRGLFDQKGLVYELKVAKIVTADPTHTVLGGFAIIPDFSQSVRINNSVTGNASRVTLTAIKNTDLTKSEHDFAGAIHDTTNFDPVIAQSGIVICMQEGGGGRKGSITIGAGGQRLSLTRTVDEWPAECN